MNSAHRFILLLLLLSTSPSFATEDLATRVKIIFEICRPNHSVETATNLGYESISDSGYGGFWLSPGRKTESGEPVYYSYAGNETNHVAIVARFIDTKEMKFIFLRPSKDYLRFENWSTWLPPNTVTDDSRVEGKILRNIDYNKSSPDSQSPLIRYRLMRMVDYLKTVRDKTLPPEVIEGGTCLE